MNQNRKCVYSPNKEYRYTLWREFDKGDGYVQFIGLNPSTATDEIDDPTVRRCINFAKSWGFRALCMTNAFGYRATDPMVMKAIDKPIGQDNDLHLARIASEAGVVIAAWGTHGIHNGRDAEICKLIPNLHCLAITKGGFPGHPLYLKKSLTPIPYPPKVAQ